MNIAGIVIFLAVSAVAGWLGRNIMNGRRLVLLGNVLVGMVGALLLVGRVLFGLLGISAGGRIGSIITAAVSAIVLLFLVGMIKRA
jgi:uncharacterized membrane protein YeaQ/YmgE (transglycosylase-associated protein family)